MWLPTGKMIRNDHTCNSHLLMRACVCMLGDPGSVIWGTQANEHLRYLSILLWSWVKVTRYQQNGFKFVLSPQKSILTNCNLKKLMDETHHPEFSEFVEWPWLVSQGSHLDFEPWLQQAFLLLLLFFIVTFLALFSDTTSTLFIPVVHTQPHPGSSSHSLSVSNP